MFYTAFAFAGGSKDFTLNFMNALLTGSRPADMRPFNARAVISHLKSVNIRLGILNIRGSEGLCNSI